MFLYRFVVLLVLAFLLGAVSLMSVVLLTVEATTATNVERTDQLLEDLEERGYKLNAIWSMVDDQYNTEVVPLYGASSSTSEEEYYRGVYDTCMEQMKRPEFCGDAVRGIFKADWFGQPTMGWTWPLPTAPGTAPNLDPKGSTG